MESSVDILGGLRLRGECEGNNIKKNCGINLILGWNVNVVCTRSLDKYRLRIHERVTGEEATYMYKKRLICVPRFVSRSGMFHQLHCVNAYSKKP